MVGTMLTALMVLLAAPPIDVDARAGDYVDRYFGTVGVAVVVLREGTPSYHFAGRAAKDGSVALGEDTLFEIGSITKVFTTLALQRGVDAGRVRLETTAGSLLPGKIPLAGVTLEQLATHRSGLPRLPGNLFRGPLGPLTERGDPYAAYDADALHGWLRTWEPEPGPRAVKYSNLGAGLLGHVLARQAKLSYAALLARDVTGPLKMTDTVVEVDAARQKRMAVGHGTWGGVEQPWGFRVLAPAGALKSTPRDMLRFLRANVGSGPPKVVAALRRTHAKRHDTRKGGGVGLGWWRRPVKERTIVWHNGGTGGFRSYLGFIEGTTTGVVVLGNSSTSVDALGRDILLGISPPLRSRRLRPRR